MKHFVIPEDHINMSVDQWELYNRHLPGSDKFCEWANETQPPKLEYREWNNWYNVFAKRKLQINVR